MIVYPNNLKRQKLLFWSKHPLIFLCSGNCFQLLHSFDYDSVSRIFLYVGFVNICGNICEFFLLNDEQKLCNLRLNVKFLTRTCNYLSVVGWEQHMCSDSRLGHRTMELLTKVREFWNFTITVQACTYCTGALALLEAPTIAFKLKNLLKTLRYTRRVIA